MIFSCIFYWILSWYFEKVFPGEYGIPLNWNFLFKRDYWRSEKIDNHTHSFSNPSGSISRRNSINTPIVHVNHLVKKFGPDKIAVNNVSFDLYENQITSLLGPNGSGKTTIFNCLIGIYKQTSGTITIESEDGIDRDTRTNMEILRKSMGYCPQHDILFDLLTIQEQIKFYAIARGFEKNQEEIANEMIRLVNLESSKNFYCNSLSGGMKRRLSLACAFVGNTKIILLDEVIIE
jgi:ATP-binding cassette subfamily A (ABC1) protein 1